MLTESKYDQLKVHTCCEIAWISTTRGHITIVIDAVTSSLTFFSVWRVRTFCGTIESNESWHTFWKTYRLKIRVTSLLITVFVMSNSYTWISRSHMSDISDFREGVYKIVTCFRIGCSLELYCTTLSMIINMKNLQILRKWVHAISWLSKQMS